MINKFCETIKRLRTDTKVTQTELAQYLNISQRTYSNYETGRNEPDLDTLILLSNYFHVPVDVLIGKYSLPDTPITNHKVIKNNFSGINQINQNITM
ncbi:MAG: helix-turn-helix domain-containing protein [Oscillospiraceae bacterium]|jgi:transcriptional regulator with XRE-family HTH domain|nr:helix-turn-helix domain-containing protein [Oscillospiraceae bacterium]